MARFGKRVSALFALTLSLFGTVDALATKDTLSVTILADTNRDGVVDTTGGRDFEDKQKWSLTRGALFLPNIADTDRRCSWQINSTTPNEMLPLCHDGSDNVLRNEKLLAPVRTVPKPSLPDSAKGSLVIEDPQAAAKVRVFHKTMQGQWAYVHGNYSFSAQDLRSGLTLGVDGRDVRRPGGWDGRAMLRLRVQDSSSGQEATDAVMMRVAPVLTHHHGQLVQQVITSDGVIDPMPGLPKPPVLLDQKKFVEDLEIVNDQIDFDDPLRPLHSFDVWTQDFVEPAYATIPGPSPDGPGGDPGVIGLRIMVRSVQDHREAGKLAFSDLRSAKVGAVQHAGRGSTQDSMGNLETVPPHSFKGRTWPAGRTVMGVRNGQAPLLIPFLQAQEEQEPIEIDTSWLYVGHVDEHMQFLPVDRGSNARGWVLMVADPMAGLQVLREAQEAGNGHVRAMSRKDMATDDASFCVPTSTIDQVLAFDNLTQVQEYCHGAIKHNVDIIKRETGLGDADVFSVPSLFYWDELPFIAPGSSCSSIKPGAQGNSSTSDQTQAVASLEQVRQKHLSVHDAGVPPEQRLQRRGASGARAMEFGALYPSAINSIVSRAHKEVIAPQPWGPVVQGRDVMLDAINAAYAKVGYSVRYIDDWSSHHMNLGEVHCGTNTLRDMEAPWWQ
ncbi:hypothetical protein CDD81_3515 [Ophiocordyceps australis]|uniref:Protein-arginine deiminase C-terminal domain-containing protein n=1 Tax=Ophiocordyceps australis TaxID=1399860 RepID=A0A2C5XE31_9HYPO|nr:hypothetical protein CDD81_3515 [Ophiocordyceps australis]